MEFFESQVGEVRYLTTLAETPAAASASPASSSLNSNHHNHDHHHHNHTNNSHGHGHGHGLGIGHNHAHDHGLIDRGLDPGPGHHLHHPASSNNVVNNARSVSVSSTTAGTKRKDSGTDELPPSKATPQQRSKRNRYISIACNECKRRKIKCNGETPCQRCGNLNLQCLYAPNCCSNNVKDSEEFKQMARQVSQLQEQVETLFSSMNALRSEALRLAPIQDRSLPVPPSASSTPSSTSMTIASLHRPDLPQLRQPGFRGPTSTRFSLDVAKNTLHKMGYGNTGDCIDLDGSVHETPTTSPRITQQVVPSPYNTRPPPDPLWEFDKDELIRLCRVYEEEVGIMWPIVRIESIINHAKSVGAWIEAAKNNAFVPPLGSDGTFSDHNSILLKVVVCNGLLVEEHGNSEKAERLFESIKPITNRMLSSDPSNVRNIPILALTAGYYFFSTDEILSWRTMGQVARYCFELGLHRRDAIEQIADEEERRNAVFTFWTAFVLDRRWSFSTGLPFVISDEEVDPELPYPDEYPFLVAMITYSKLSAKVWRLRRQFEPNAPLELQASEIEDMDQRIKQWYREVPNEVRLDLADWEALPRYLNPPVNSQKEYDIERLQIWTYLRLNQIRTWLYTPILHTHSSIMENLHHAECVVKLAKNTITYLTHLNNTTNLYRKMQTFYHQFLSAAITVLFLASCHAPVNFSSACRDEFYMALELVKDLSSKSWVSKRLWSTIKSLREFAPRLGLAEDPHSTAALTMAGLATGQMRPTPSPTATSSAFGPPQPPMARPPASPDDAQNGLQMSSEMGRIFEDYMGKGGNSIPGNTTTLPHHDPRAAIGPTTPTAINTESPIPYATGPETTAAIGNIYQHFKDMF
ncbi:hypothetical protein F4809DRAFT_625385 [Biscogniauxia mediterranea]|nr:hypothetical protein F4809DRAFT_625385 [Biscogniauxia mediterranea]